MSCVNDTVVCIAMLFKWLLYFCVVTIINLYVAKCYMSGYFTVHVSSI